MVRTPVSSFTQYAQQARSRIDHALAEYAHLGVGCPEPLRQSIEYSLLAPGKRLRPLLVVMAAEACGGSIEAALPAACAVEMIHTYSLIHDDLPAMDDDDLRRGRPTNHKKFGEALAILAGDALLTMAFEVLSHHVQPPQTAAACCAALSRAAGPAALVGGQAADIAGQTAGQTADQTAGQSIAGRLETLESIHRRKTGAMFLVCLRLGALVAGADHRQIAALETYGRNLGLAFQIIDDLLDVSGTEAALGKRVGKDADRGKMTFPGLLGVEESRRRAAELISQACLALEPLGTAAEPLEALARYVEERDR